MDRVSNQMMDDAQFQEMMSVLNGIVERIKQLEAEVKKTAPNPTQRIQDLGMVKNGPLSSLPSIRSLTTK